MRRAASSILLTVVMVALPSLGQEADQFIEAQVDGRTEELQIDVDTGDLATTGPIWWRRQISVLGPDYVRLHVRISAPPAADAVLVVRGGGSELQYALSTEGSDEFWTGIVLGGNVGLSLMGPSRPVDLELEIDQITMQVDSGEALSTWGEENETKGINHASVPEEVRALGLPVAKLVFQSEGKPRTCTGFLVSMDALLTNEHCVHSAEACDSLDAIFGYEHDAAGRITLGKQFKCAAYSTENSNHDLDATLITLVGEPGGTYGHVSLWAGDPDPDSPLVIIQHPEGKRKQVSFVNCRAMDVPAEGRKPDFDFTHTCDTAGGSSGSPVFNSDGELVGLHHYGFADDDVSTWTENRAVRWTLLRAWMEGRLIELGPEAN